MTANTITYRLEKGSALTYQELDDNFRYLDAKEVGGAGATFDEDKDTGMDPEVSEDEDILRFFVGNSIPGYSNVQSVMTLAANGLSVNMGQSNQTGSTVDGAPIIFRAGSGANAVFHADTKGGDIELRPGNYNTYANTDIANTSTPSREGVVRVIGPNVNGPGVARFYDTDRDKFVGISGPDNLDTSYTIKLPIEVGTVGQALVLQNSSGNTTWGAAGGGGGSDVAGTNRQVQYNDNGEHGAANVFYVSSTQNFGVGISTPNTIVHISTGADITKDAIVIVESDADAAGGLHSGVWFKSRGDRTQAAIQTRKIQDGMFVPENQLQIISTANLASNDTSGIGFYLGDTSQTGITDPVTDTIEWMSIIPDINGLHPFAGIVGIACTTPQSTLDVAGVIFAGGLSLTPTAEMISAGQSDGVLFIVADEDGTNPSAHPKIIFAQDGGQYYSGIQLDNNELQIISNASTGAGIEFYTGTTDNSGFGANPITGATRRILITDSGDVAIGSGTPAQTLDVAGTINTSANVHITGSIRDSSGDFGTSGQILSSTGAGINWINAVDAESNTFSTITVLGQDSVVAETDDDTLTFVAGSNMTITTDASTDTITFAASAVASESNTFSTIAVSGQDSVVAETDDDTLTFVAGSNMTITTDAATDTITFAASGGGGTGDISANGTTTFAYAANTEVTIWTSNNQIMGTPAFKFDYSANTLTVNGHIQATTKSFLIKHPTKEHYMLQYASLEGPENGVYVRGKSSQNVIELPEYWVNLVDEESITVELTPNGFYQELFVKEINNNRVYVSNNKSDSLRYFYHVYAERKDVPKLETEYEVALKWP